MIVNIINDTSKEIDQKQISDILESTTEQKANELKDKLVKVDIFIVRKPRMRSLHQKWMETAVATDVLSFPTWEHYTKAQPDADGNIYLGDIVICYPVACAQAKENNRSIQEEINFLAQHGFLHLLGYHHE